MAIDGEMVSGLVARHLVTVVVRGPCSPRVDSHWQTAASILAMKVVRHTQVVEGVATTAGTVLGAGNRSYLSNEGILR
jgi:hypothetical protein